MDVVAYIALIILTVINMGVFSNFMRGYGFLMRVVIAGLIALFEIGLVIKIFQ